MSGLSGPYMKIWTTVPYYHDYVYMYISSSVTT